jgi:very-short-patch-repair endonuclease
MTESTENQREWKTDPGLWEKLKPLAREMRQQRTPAENVLWQCLRSRKLNGLKFRRQHPIERFIVDFFCAEARLVIEVDGSIHQYTAEEDKFRQAFLESLNLHVLRFTNDDVLHSTTAVIEKMATMHLPSPNSERGRG